MAIRALILAGGASPHRPGLDAAWPGWDRDLDVVIAADAGALLAAPLGLSLDLIVGDGDSLGEEALAAFIEQGVAVERAPIDKDSSDTELALVAAAVSGATDLVVVGAFGGRLDHALANIWILAHPRLAGRTVALLDDRTRVRLLTAPAAGSPTRTAVALAGRAGDLVTLLPLDGPATGVTTRRRSTPIRTPPPTGSPGWLCRPRPRTGTPRWVSTSWTPATSGQGRIRPRRPWNSPGPRSVRPAWPAPGT